MGLYKSWLSGRSLRALGRALGCSHNTIASILKSNYGDRATNLIARSFERSLVQDHGLAQIDYAFDLAVAYPAGDGHKHRSKHSIKQLTTFQSSGREHIIDTISSLGAYRSSLEALEDIEAPKTDFLRLALLRGVLGTVSRGLAVAVAAVSPCPF